MTLADITLTLICFFCIASLYPLYLLQNDRYQRRLIQQRAENHENITLIEGMERLKIFNDLKQEELTRLYDLARASEMLLAEPKDPDNWCELQNTFKRVQPYIID